VICGLVVFAFAEPTRCAKVLGTFRDPAKSGRYPDFGVTPPAAMTFSKNWIKRMESK
jgi:hypothetical protein